MINKCEVCGIEFESVKPAKTCSPKCRVTLSRLGVTHNPNVTLDTPRVTSTVTFEFYTIRKAREPLKGEVKEQDVKSPTRTAVYWYDVPLGAVPKRQKDWPEMPDYMNGREYFLWWKNEFKINDKKEPVVHNPFPTYEKLDYFQAGEGSRRWGA